MFMYEYDLDIISDSFYHKLVYLTVLEGILFDKSAECSNIKIYMGNE